MVCALKTPQIHIANFSGNWKNVFFNHGKIKLSKDDLKEYEKGKVQLKESKIAEIGSIFTALKTVYFPDTLSLFKSDSLTIALEKARQLMYRTHLQVSNTFNELNPDFFGLGEDSTLVPAYIDFHNKIESINIHTEGGKGVNKTQALTYMPSSIRGILTLYKLFDTDLQMFDNTTLHKKQFALESVSITNMNPNQMPVVFMVDGQDGTAHSATVPKSENSERMIWTIIINSIGKEKLTELIPDYPDWLEKDILRYAKNQKREDSATTSTLSQYSIRSY